MVWPVFCSLLKRRFLDSKIQENVTQRLLLFLRRPAFEKIKKCQKIFLFETIYLFEILDLEEVEMADHKDSKAITEEEAQLYDRQVSLFFSFFQVGS